MRVSVVIPTYNHCNDLLVPCVESIKKYTDLTDVEVIVVANGCRDNTREYVNSLGSPFKLVWFDEGLGYTKAANAGIREAVGEVIILLNNDVELLPQERHTWIKYLCDPLKDNIGMTTPLKLWDWSVDRKFAVFFCVAIPRKMFDKLGLLNEEYSPGGCEDIEFSIKVEELGYRVIQVPDEINVVRDGLNVNRFPIYHPGEGTMLDAEHRDGWPAVLTRNREILSRRYKLPDGWFYGGDIAEYRRLVEDVPVGGTIGELGCAYGRSICSVADIIKRKSLRFIIVDTFEGTRNEPGAYTPISYRNVFEANVARFGLTGQITIFQGLTSVVCGLVQDRTFDLLFIDADHSYEAVKGDIESWLPKMKLHSTISGHDYGNHPGVARAVNEKWDNIRLNDEHFQIDSGIATGSVWSKRL